MFAVPLRVLAACSTAIAIPALAGATGEVADTEQPASAGHLTLPVAAVVARFPPYAAFCERQPGECALAGELQIESSPDLMRRLRHLNSDVNREIRFALDKDQYGREEYWALPASGYGDCEDMALEKRARLARDGLPTRALRLAFVFHRKRLDSHCILTVETSAGTYVLDSYNDTVLRWDETPYNFEARERPDGRWDRFDQSGWYYAD